MHHDADSAHPLDNRAALVRALNGTGWIDRNHTAGPLRGLRLVSDQLTAQTVSAELVAAEGDVSGYIWSRYLSGGIASAALRAATTTSDQDRPYLLAFLDTWADTVFADRSSTLRFGTAAAQEWAAADSSGATVVVASQYKALYKFVDRSSGPAAPPAVGPIHQVAPVRLAWGDASQLRSLTALVRDRGPLPHDADAVRLLAESTGLSNAAATLILAGQLDLVGTHSDRKDRKAVGKTLTGVNATALEDAWQELDDFHSGKRIEATLWADALPDNPAELWTEDGIRSTALRFAESWNLSYGHRTPVPEDTLAAAGKVLDQLNRKRGRGLSAATLCTDVTNPETPRPVHLDLYWQRIMLTCRWAYAHLPAGDPVRTAVPQALTALRTHLRHPDQLINAGPVPSQTVTAMSARAGTTTPGSFDNGLLLATDNGNANGWVLRFRPANYGIDERTAELRAIAPREHSLLFADLDWLFGPDCDRMIARITTGGLPVDGYELDPQLSAPDVTARVAAELDLDTDAAALYLQLATLVQPSDKNIRRWNRWTPARHRKAETVLVEAGLSVHDKRGRVGRGAFLPGPWDTVFYCEKWKREIHRTYQQALGVWETPEITPEFVLSELFERGLEAARAAGVTAEPEDPSHAAGTEPVRPTVRTPIAGAPCATDGIRRHALDHCSQIAQALNGRVINHGRNPTVLRELQIISNVLRGHDLPASIDPEELVRTANVWMPFVSGVGAAALRAVSPVTSERDRHYLLAFLEVWADTVFADPDADLRVGSTVADVWVTSDTHGAVVLYPLRAYGEWFIASRYGTGEPPVPGTVKAAQRLDRRWGTAEQVRTLVDLVRENGSAPWDPDAAAEFSRRTGVSRACATMVLAGFIGWAFRYNPLDQDILTLLGLSQSEAADAAEELLEVERVGQSRAEYAVLAQALPDDPADLWRPDGMLHSAECAADAWIAAYGRRPPVAAETIAEAAEFRRTLTTLHYPASGAGLCGILAAPGDTPLLNEPLKAWPELSDENRCYLEGDDLYRRFIGQWQAILETCRWAYSHLPQGDSIRAGAADTLRSMRAQLRSPDLLLTVSMLDTDDRMAALFRLTGADPQSDEHGNHWYDDGFVVAGIGGKGGWQSGFRPVHYAADARTDWLRSSDSWRPYDPTLNYLDWISGPDCDAMLARLDANDLPTGGYEADPKLSAPDLVDEVAARLGTDSDAAALYLQLLTLLDPSDSNIRRWNQWTAARHTRAEKALRATGRVDRTRRKGAGRSSFLPGHWMKDPGFEHWKMTLHQLPYKSGSNAGAVDMEGAYALRKPLPDLYQAAWQRILTGDLPA